MMHRYCITVDEPDKVIQPWGVFGGTPYYLQALEQETALSENIQSLILSEHGVLHNEPEFLLRTEFGIREPQTYYTFLRAIATGKRKANEIASFAGVDSNSLGSYLSKLRRLRLVERDIPVTANPNATRKSQYRLKEPLFRFWFRYVYGQSGELAQLGSKAYEEVVEPTSRSIWDQCSSKCVRTRSRIWCRRPTVGLATGGTNSTNSMSLGSQAMERSSQASVSTQPEKCTRVILLISSEVLIR